MYALKNHQSIQTISVPMHIVSAILGKTRFEFLTSLPKIYQPVAKTPFNFSLEKQFHTVRFLNQEMVSYQLHFIKILT
jgi:hypothetical protein